MSAIPILKFSVFSNMTSTKPQTPSAAKDTSEKKATTQKVTKCLSLQDVNIGASETCLGMAKTTQKPCKHSIPKERRDAAKVLERELALAAFTKNLEQQPKEEDKGEDEFVIVDEELGALLMVTARLSLCHHHKQQLGDIVDTWIKVADEKQPAEEAQVPADPGKDHEVPEEEEAKDGEAKDIQEEQKPEVKIEEGESDKKEQKPELKTEESVAGSKQSIFGRGF